MNEPQHKIAHFMEQQQYCVVSSVNEAGQPESALVAFSQTDNLELIFGTNEQSRKCQNILLNPNVSVVVGWDEDDLTTVQYEGVARVLPLKYADDYAPIHYAKHPGSARHKEKSGEVFIVVTPVWARLTDYGVDSGEIFEEHFNAD